DQVGVKWVDPIAHPDYQGLAGPRNVANAAYRSLVGMGIGPEALQRWKRVGHSILEDSRLSPEDMRTQMADEMAKLIGDETGFPVQRDSRAPLRISQPDAAWFGVPFADRLGGLTPGGDPWVWERIPLERLQEIEVDWARRSIIGRSRADGPEMTPAERGPYWEGVRDRELEDLRLTLEREAQLSAAGASQPYPSQATKAQLAEKLPERWDAEGARRGLSAEAALLVNGTAPDALDVGAGSGWGPRTIPDAADLDLANQLHIVAQLNDPRFRDAVGELAGKPLQTENPELGYFLADAAMSSGDDALWAAMSEYWSLDPAQRRMAKEIHAGPGEDDLVGRFLESVSLDKDIVEHLARRREGLLAAWRKASAVGDTADAEAIAARGAEIRQALDEIKAIDEQLGIGVLAPEAAARLRAKRERWHSPPKGADWGLADAGELLSWERERAALYDDARARRELVSDVSRLRSAAAVARERAERTLGEARVRNASPELVLAARREIMLRQMMDGLDLREALGTLGAGEREATVEAYQEAFQRLQGMMPARMIDAGPEQRQQWLDDRGVTDLHRIEDQVRAEVAELLQGASAAGELATALEGRFSQLGWWTGRLGDGGTRAPRLTEDTEGFTTGETLEAPDVDEPLEWEGGRYAVADTPPGKGIERRRDAGDHKKGWWMIPRTRETGRLAEIRVNNPRTIRRLEPDESPGPGETVFEIPDTSVRPDDPPVEARELYLLHANQLTDPVTAMADDGVRAIEEQSRLWNETRRDFTGNDRARTVGLRGVARMADEDFPAVFQLLNGELNRVKAARREWFAERKRREEAGTLARGDEYYQGAPTMQLLIEGDFWVVDRPMGSDGPALSDAEAVRMTSFVAEEGADFARVTLESS
ncbi:MAG: hypothetical protein OXG69_15505, partial [bacterium]|nr:hypothetical protein [bacterium]